MTGETTEKIRKFSTDVRKFNSLEALMTYYNVTNLMRISEEQALNFLAKLENGEIRIPLKVKLYGKITEREFYSILQGGL